MPQLPCACAALMASCTGRHGMCMFCENCSKCVPSLYPFSAGKACSAQRKHAAGLASSEEHGIALHCRCVSPTLIVVAAMTHGRSVFLSSPDKRAEAMAAHAQITANSRAGKSDHLAIIAAFNGWTAAWTKGGRQKAHTVRLPSQCRDW